MLISHPHQFIYTKTNKTAGTSVEAYFQEYCLPPDSPLEIGHATPTIVSEEGIIGYRGPFHYGQRWYNHMSAAAIRRKVGQDVWNQYFKFCVVRNPYDKMISLFYHLKKSYETSVSKETLRNCVKYFIGKRHTVYWPSKQPEPEQFREWVRRGGHLIDRNKYTVDGQLAVDFTIRYEALAEGIQEVCRRLNLPYQPDRLPSFNTQRRSRTIPLSDYYDDETKKIVANTYAFEIREFEYSFPDSPSEPSKSQVSL